MGYDCGFQLGSISLPRGPLELETFLVVIEKGEGVTGVLWVNVRERKSSKCTRKSHTKKNYLVPKANSTMIENPGLREK